jgi:rfaE bifunctional protein kinase chain/domain
MSDLSDLIKNEFQQKKIVIIGDLVADQFLRGTIARVSREAPVFILRHDETETFPGGAANAAVNVAALGGAVSLIGLIGADGNGEALAAKLGEQSVDCRFIVSSEKMQTTTKVRVLAAQHYAPRQQVIRIDYENPSAIDEETKNKLRDNLMRAGENADAIIFSDYNYGVADTAIYETAKYIAAERKIPLLIDSRFRLADFPNATSATPNQEEVEQILGENFTDDDCESLREKLNFEALLVTCGNQGMLLVEKDKKPLRIEAVGAKEPVDVTGAGDTVIAVYGLGLACGLSFAESARMSNAAGGIVVMKKGTASVGADELLSSLQSSAQTTNG